MRYLKALGYAIFYPFYFIIAGAKDKLIDLENKDLARQGRNKVCVDIRQSDHNPLTGSYTSTKVYTDGDPNHAPKRFISFIECIKISQSTE